MPAFIHMVPTQTGDSSGVPTIPADATFFTDSFNNTGSTAIKVLDAGAGGGVFVISASQNCYLFITASAVTGASESNCHVFMMEFIPKIFHLPGSETDDTYIQVRGTSVTNAYLSATKIATI